MAPSDELQNNSAMQRNRQDYDFHKVLADTINKVEKIRLSAIK